MKQREAREEKQVGEEEKASEERAVKTTGKENEIGK